MFTKTTQSAISALIYMARNGREIDSPKQVAIALGESPSYLAKVLSALVKSGILRAVRGMKGGVQFGRPPVEISLLSIVETCQGMILGDHCRGQCEPELTCAFHRAALELREAIVQVLSRWNLAHLIAQPIPLAALPYESECKLLGIDRLTVTAGKKAKIDSAGRGNASPARRPGRTGR
jgi:Rrf2 family protein